MKRFLSLFALIVLVASGVWAEDGEVVKPRHDLAITMGTPGIVNASYTLSFNPTLGIRATAGGSDVNRYWVGLQGELFFVLKHTQKFTADVSLGIGGYWGSDGDDDEGTPSYTAILANSRYRRFIAQLGTGPVMTKSGMFDHDVALVFQIGYIVMQFK